MTNKKNQKPNKKPFDMPSAEKVRAVLSKAESMDDFFGKEGIFSNLFAETLEQMLEAELSEELGYEKYEATGRNSGNSRNGSYRKKVRSSAAGDLEVRVPRDRNGEFEPKIIPKYGANTNELEEKILGMYAKGVSTRDIQDILIAAMDGLSGFSDALHAVFPQTQVQRCVIHQIRASWKYVSWRDRKAFVRDLKSIYKASSREAAEANLERLDETWSGKYAIAVRSWQDNWAELSTFFDYPAEIRRLIYTTNAIEGYNRQLRKVTKNKASLPTQSPSGAQAALPGQRPYHQKVDEAVDELAVDPQPAGHPF